MQLKVQEVNSGRQYVFEAKRWLRVDHHHDHWREFPVYTKDEEDMLQGQFLVDRTMTGWTGP